MLETRVEYDCAVAIVRGVIHAWDPYGLIAGGAPADEWDGEIAAVVAQTPRIRSENNAAEVISRVFTSAFQSDGFGPLNCADVGRRLFSALAEFSRPEAANEGRRTGRPEA